MPRAPNLNPPASSAAAPQAIFYFLMGADNQEREKP